LKLLQKLVLGFEKLALLADGRNADWESMHMDTDDAPISWLGQ